jgi:hypothetical protein
MSAWPPTEWLGEEVSLNDTSQSYALTKLLPLALPGDEIRAYASPLISWKKMMGLAGVVLMREGRIISDVVTMRN